MKIAIVGPEESKWLPNQKDKVKSEIFDICVKYLKEAGISFIYKDGRLFDFPEDVVIVSGHCPKGGVDIWAEEVADENGIRALLFPADIYQWEDYITPSFGPFPEENLMGYKSRNIKIAKTCDILYCIVPKSEFKYCTHCNVKGHPHNGGCWTMKYAKKLGKEVHLIVIE